MRLNPATVLKTGAVVFGGSAIALFFVPGIFLDLLGFPGSADLDWSMRMIGITVAALAGNMWNVATSGSPETVRTSARVMQASAFALGALTLYTPHPYTWFVIAYAVIGFAFSIAYTISLSSKRSESTV